jgi:mono/diheme cytochrome c family protein
LREARRIVLITFVVAALLLVAVAACGDDGEPTHEHAAEFLDEGQAPFSVNCADCHGASSGSDVAGKSESSVTKTVRQ